MNLFCRFLGHRWKWLSAVYTPRTPNEQPHPMAMFGFSHASNLTTVTKLCTRCKEIESSCLHGEITIDQLNGSKDAEVADLERMAR